MKDKIRKMLPKTAKDLLRKVEDVAFRLRAGFTYPLVVTDIFGLRLILEPGDKRATRWFVGNVYYKNELNAMRHLVRNGNTVFDIGANIGVISLYLSKLTTDGKVYSFEPAKENIEKIRSHIALNKAENILLSEIAISDENKSGTMYLYEDNLELGSLGKIEGYKLDKEIPVSIQTLDSFCEEKSVGRIHFLKVDTEGFELEVFKGCKELFDKELVDHIQFEISRTPLCGRGIDPLSVFNILSESGFMIFKYVDEKDIFVPVTEDDKQEHFSNFYASRFDISKSI